MVPDCVSPYHAWPCSVNATPRYGGHFARWLHLRDVDAVPCRMILATANGATRSRPSQTFRTMSDLHGYLIIDASSGTVLPASACYLVADDAMPDDAWHAMADDDWSDDDAINAAQRYGRKLSDIVTTSPKLPGEV